MKKELKQSKENVMFILDLLLETYKDQRVVLEKPHAIAKKTTLKTYDDFYEWLQGRR